NQVFAYDYTDTVRNALSIDQQVNYLSKTKEWVRNTNSDGINFRKDVTKGTGGFSILDKDGNFYDTNTTYEFFDGKKLIGHNMHLLKFFELGFDDKVTQRELSPEEIKVYFPDVELVYISKFKNNKIVLKKQKNEKKTYLLVNDTDRDFYKYSFENSEYKDEYIRGLFEVEKPQTLIFSHFGSRDKLFPILKIKIKND
uniref:hypothetical protein n=1 Tax=Candidatus Scatousia sp. TaxID=3085663 RepID=UPI004028593E